MQKLSLARHLARLAIISTAALPLALAMPAAAQRGQWGPRQGPCWQPDGSWNQEACPWQPGQGPGMMGQRGPGMMGPGQGPGMGQGMGQGRFIALIDLNGDGVISADEAAAFVEQMFDSMDEDEDDVLSRDEFMVLRGGGMRPTQAQAALARKEARFKAMDKNGDGSIDHDEFIAWHQARYQAADINKDGKVSVWEFRAIMRQP